MSLHVQHTAAINFPVHMGNREDFDSIFKVYYAALCFFSGGLTKDDSLAEDVVTDVFMNLWEKNTLLESKPHAQAFLYRSVKNASINLINYGKRVSAKHLDIAQDATAEEEDYLDGMIKTEVWAEIYRAIENLPSQCSKVMSLSFIDGMTNQEIANELGLSMQTVKNHKVRGLQKLKEDLPENLLILLICSQYLL